jgi:hypothetical protein
VQGGKIVTNEHVVRIGNVFVDLGAVRLPVTVELSGTARGALGGNALVLGSLAGGTQGFRGTRASLLIWSRALTDEDMIREMSATRTELATRSISIP